MIVTPAVRNTAVAAGLLVGSYLLSGLVNAATLTQPTLRSSHARARVIIVSASEAESPQAVERIPLEEQAPARPVIAGAFTQKSI